MEDNVRDFMKFFQGRRSGQSPRPPIGFRDIVVLAVIVLVIGIAASQMLVVKENEYRVIRSWTGAVVRVMSEPGLAWKMPFLESSESLPKAKRLYNGHSKDILTSDQKPLIVDNYAVWQISDPMQFVANTRSVAKAESYIDAAIYSTVRAVMSSTRYDALIAADAEKSGRNAMSEEITRMVNESLAAGQYGITVQDVRLKRIDLPQQNLQSVYNRMKSDRAKIAADYLSQGDEAAIKIKAETDRTVAELLSEGNRQAKEIEAQGEKEAAAIYNQVYGADPEFYTMYRTLESYRTSLNNKPMIVIPSNSPYARYLLGQ
ncbi:MAG TPA: protease modulator HflC [Symbiobacteriaceae bacterium]|jgi:modulator of FtsH protease HflC|nr:protease modulator HflC [Symbiobacteriaceae bacterium]